MLLLRTFKQGLKLFLHARAARAAVAGEGLHPEQVGCARGQVADLHRILLEYEHDVGRHIQVIILGDGRGEVREEFSKMMMVRSGALSLK